jgi:hypothetical protein
MDVENPRLLVGSKIQSLPEILILPLDAASKVSMTEPDVLPDLNVMVPVPLITGPLNVRVILVVIATLVAALAGSIELGDNGTVVKL